MGCVGVKLSMGVSNECRQAFEKSRGTYGVCRFGEPRKKLGNRALETRNSCN